MKKKFLIILLCVLLVITGGGLWGYRHFFGVDEKLRAEIQREFTEDFFRFTDLDLDDLFDEDEEVVEESREALSSGVSRETTEVSNQNDVEIASNVPVDNVDNNTKKAARVTEETIANKYTPRFQRLEALAIERIDALFERAYQEYREKSKSKNFSRSELARKYLQAGAMLEESVDDRFDQLLKEMERELQEHKLSNSLVKEAQKSYKTAIEEKKSSLLEKLDGII